MKHSRVLLVAHGFLGDNLFISSVAEHLLREGKADHVDFFTGFPQVYELLEQNPYISEVFITPFATQHPQSIVNQYDLSSYDKIFTFSPFSFDIPPALEAQIRCGIETPSPEFTVYTVASEDQIAEECISELRRKSGKPVVAWMNNWKQKAFSFTEDQYWNGTDDPNKLTGYGRENRNISRIVDQLSEYFNMISVGVPENISQFDTAKDNFGYPTFSQNASLLKYCDYFIGTEGGLANLAAGVGCKTILTYEFIWQCYGPRGTVRPFKSGPMLGPVHYFTSGHTYLPLYKSDDEIVMLIKEHVMKETS